MRIRVDDGVTLATVVAGPDDAPGLLLVHGFGGAKEDFADHVDALAVDHRVVVFDHRGHGESDKPDDPACYSLDRIAADVPRSSRPPVCATCACSGTRWAGWSPGGSRWPTRPVSHALVLMDTSPGPPPGLDPELIEFGVEVVRTHGMVELKRLQDELDPLGSPSYRRVLPNDRASPSTWPASGVRSRRRCGSRWRVEIVTSPTSSPRWRRSRARRW